MIKKLFVLLVIAVIIVFAAFLLPNVSAGTDSKKTEYLLIPSNATLGSIVDSLNNKKTVISALSFYFCAQVVGYDKKIKEGRYELKNGINNLFLLNNLIKGRQKPLRISFNNIRTKEQLCARIGNQLMLDSLQLHEALSNNDSLKQYGVDSNTSVALFIPNTYEVYWNISTQKLLKKMVTAYQEFWTDKRKEKAQAIPLHPIEVSIVASIVEEESNLSAEKPIIAGLYINRLKKNMPLQADPTIKFALKAFDLKRVLFKHIEASKSSAYNTYLNKGLPPGPIRIPSIESIDAVLNYQQHPYLFMCAKGSGGSGHDFAVTFQEHLQNANRYRSQMNKLGIK
jgi:UPF0755 protein